MTTYRAVLVGCGPRGVRHAQALLTHPERFVLAGICDLDRTRLAACAAELGMTTTYTEAETMLATEQPDVLCFATMPQMRLPLVALGIKHGVKAIACEKPLALSLGEAKQIVDLCAIAGVKLIVCHQWKFSALWRQTYEIVHSGDLGAIHTIHASSRPSMLRAGTHLVDCMLWLNHGAEGAWVLGQAHGVAAYEEDHPCPDHLAGLVHFTNGVRGILECGTLAPQLLKDDHFWEDCGVTVYGTHGYVRAVLGSGWQAVTRTSSGTLRAGPPDPTPQEPAYLQALAHWLDDPQQVHPSNGTVSYAGFELLMGMVVSSLERRKVDLPIAVIPEQPELPRLQEALLRVGR